MNAAMVPGAVTAGRKAVDAGSNRSTGDRADELGEPSFIGHDLAGLFRDSHGPAGAPGLVPVIISAMPGFRLLIEDISGTDDRAAVRDACSGGDHRFPGRDQLWVFQQGLEAVVIRPYLPADTGGHDRCEEPEDAAGLDGGGHRDARRVSV
jgi:hypothetical protein